MLLNIFLGVCEVHFSVFDSLLLIAFRCSGAAWILPSMKEVRFLSGGPDPMSQRSPGIERHVCGKELGPFGHLWHVM